MRMLPRLLLGCGLVLATASVGRAAACDPSGADAQAVADARADVVAQCDCAGAENHGAYVRCSAGVLKARVDAELLPKNCKGVVQRCAARSTCGKPGFVTCCRTDFRGRTSCSTKSSSDRCKAPKNGSACVGNFSSCCEACGEAGCVPPPAP